jgi:hypothetical protein
MARTIARGSLLWGVGWLALVIGSGFWLWRARENALLELADPGAQEAWEEWRQTVERQARNPDVPVRRKPPNSRQPPGAVLLRDAFAAVVAGVLVTASVLYGFLMMIVRGMARGRRQPGQGPLQRPGDPPALA